MFEAQTQDLPVVGAEDLYLGGASVVIGLADENGELVGYFGRDYHPNRRGQVDSIGAEEPEIGRPRMVVGLAMGDDENVIGWFGSSFLKAVGKAVTAPVKAAVTLTTAPARAVVDIAKGKNVAKTLVRTMAKQPLQGTVSTLKSGLGVAKPVVSAAAPIIKSPVTKALVGGLAIAFPPVGLPAAAGLAAANVALPYAQKGIQLATKGAAVTGSLAKSIQPKVTAKVSTSSGFSAGVSAALAAAQRRTAAQKAPPPPARPVNAVYTRTAPPSVKVQQKAPVKAPAKKPVVQPKPTVAKKPALTPAAAAADAKKKAALALATADKILSAAKGTLPSQKQAPPKVQTALKTAAKKTVAATYAAGKKTGDKDAARGLAVLTIANRLQKVVPAARAAMPQVVAPVPGQVYDAIHVDKTGRKQVGKWRAGAQLASGTSPSGVVVLRDGTPIAGAYAKVG